MKYLIGLFALVVTACGGDSPTMPSAAAQTPTPVAAAALTVNSTSSWSNCLPAVGGFPGSCQLNGSVTNTGTGCAASPTAVVALQDGGGGQIGADRALVFIMASGHVVRPNETITYQSLTIDLPTVNATKSVRVKPSWTNTTCN